MTYAITHNSNRLGRKLLIFGLIIFMLALSLFGFVRNSFAETIIKGSANSQLSASVMGVFDRPWAMTFIDNHHLLITTKPGQLWLYRLGGKSVAVDGVPQVIADGQGGLGDIITHPDFQDNQQVYLSYVASENGGNTRYAAVMSAKLELNPTPKLIDHQIIWRQYPALSGGGHFSHRLVFGPKGTAYAGQLFITSGDRQRLQPAQDFNFALGKIIRLDEYGRPPADNPFQDKGALAKTFWTLGHRNLLGIAFDKNGQLWAHEMGPQHGDELNQIIKGGNYGWPLVSEGNHYNGTVIPNHDTRPDMIAPALAWVPTIAPSGLIFYGGDLFPEWRGNAFIGGLRSQALIRVDFVNGHPVEAERFRWSMRLREIEEGPDGALYVLEDGAPARLIRLVP